ncbi:enoyl-CoA hydratase-related protein [Dactylosporangium sp. NPDC000244]|uniref:enoyl-CoA hydratase/isomerase family protein n=1 Tax=Dactylosporangium sp. NPDC000244 TaxID=3154365 RepID=UPI00332F7CEB
MSAAVLVEERDDVVLLRLNRPEVRNAIDQQMVDELHAACADLERDPRVALITGVSVAHAQPRAPSGGGGHPGAARPGPDAVAAPGSGRGFPWPAWSRTGRQEG